MHPAEDAILSEFLGDAPRASQLHELIETLRTRLQVYTAERDALPEGDPQKKSLDKKVKELKGQLTVLVEEEAVSTFVEDSVRATIARPAGMPDDLGEDDDGGPY